MIRADEAPRRVIPRVVVDARDEAARILRDARQEADRLVGAARDEAARIREQAREAGLREGQKRAAATVADAARTRDRVLDDARAQIPKLAVAVARRLVGDALQADPAQVRQLVDRAVARARRARRLELRVHPDDVPHVRGLADAPDRTVTIEADPSIARGGCILRTDVGDVDARLEVQLDALEQALSASR